MGTQLNLWFRKPRKTRRKKTVETRHLKTKIGVTELVVSILYLVALIWVVPTEMPEIEMPERPRKILYKCLSPCRKAPKLFKGKVANISITEEDVKWVHHPHNDAFVVSVSIGVMNVHRVLIDNDELVLSIPSLVALI